MFDILVFANVTKLNGWKSRIGLTPKDARIIRLELDASVDALNSFCIFDDIHLNIFNTQN